MAGLALAAVGVLTVAAPASAHDELVSTDPVAGSTTTGLPEQLTLTYSAALLSDAGGTVVEVTDAAGTSLVDGAPVVQENVVTQPLTGTADGQVNVVWRVVSSDGHPISGEFSFTATPVATADPSPSATAEPTPEASAEPTPEMTTMAPPADTSDDAAPAVWPWIIGAVGLVVLIALIVWLLGARARQQKQLDQDRTAGRGGPGER